MQKMLINIHEASSTLWISISTLYRLTSRKQIPFVKVGARCLFQPASLEAWIAERSVQPAEEAQE